MLDAQDIATLRQMFAEQDRRFVDALAESGKKTDAHFSDINKRFANVDKRIETQTSTFAAALKQSRNDIVLEIREETRAMLATAEKRIIDTIVGSIGEILDTSVLPQIAELQRDMTTVKQHLQLA